MLYILYNILINLRKTNNNIIKGFLDDFLEDNTKNKENLAKNQRTSNRYIILQRKKIRLKGLRDNIASAI